MGSLSAEDLERARLQTSQNAALSEAREALDQMFRFFREWISTTRPDADAFISVGGAGSAVGANQAMWNIDWMHDMATWREGETFEGKASPKWDVRKPDSAGLAEAAGLFKALSIDEINARLAPVATVIKDYGEAGCEGGRRLEVGCETSGLTSESGLASGRTSS